MTRQRYSVKESLNRIRDVLVGSTPGSDIPGTVQGIILSEDEAVSDIAELLSESLPGETLYLPDVTIDGITVVGTVTAEDLDVNDALTADNLSIGTGTLYAGDSRVAVGGFSDDAYFGGGRIVLAIGVSSTIPTGSLQGLTGIIYNEGGSLKYIGGSGSVSVLAGS